MMAAITTAPTMIHIVVRRVVAETMLTTSKSRWTRAGPEYVGASAQAPPLVAARACSSGGVDGWCVCDLEDGCRAAAGQQAPWPPRCGGAHVGDVCYRSLVVGARNCTRLRRATRTSVAPQPRAAVPMRSTDTGAEPVTGRPPMPDEFPLVEPVIW